MGVIDVAAANVAFSYWFGGLLVVSMLGIKSWNLLMREHEEGHHPASSLTRAGAKRLENAYNGEYGFVAQKEARLAKLEVEIVQSSHKYPVTYAFLFCSKFALFHLVFAWFCLAANLRIYSYLDHETGQQSSEAWGFISRSDWHAWYEMDLAVSA